MKKKIYTLIVTLLMILSSTLLIIPKNQNVKADLEGGESTGIDFNLGLIYRVAENLSRIIFRYNEQNGEIAKGRAFGTAGEHDAARYINDTFNIDLGINAYREQIQNIPSTFDFPGINLTDKLEILKQNITIHNNSGATETTYLSAFAIRPRWNASWRNFARLYIPLFQKYDNNELTYNFSYSNVEVVQRNYDILDWIDGFIYDKADSILENFTNGGIHNFTSLMIFLLPLFEDFYGFSFADLEANPENITALDWYETYNMSTRSNDFVFICEDPQFNPNATVPIWFPALKSLSEDIYYYRWVIERILIRFVNALPLLPDCLGIIYYDFNDNTYDMNTETYFPIPTLYINKSVGEEIYNNVEEYTIDFSFNQKYNTSIESYNVIGQINGTNPDKKVIIGELYDSWWNQGSADAAIGVGMMLCIADYMKQLEAEYNIIPKCDVKFIAFGGEEERARGAFYYEAAHNEDIETMIDLNQLGFSQSYPRLILDVITDESLNATISAITKETNYVNRTGDTADFRNINHTAMSYLTDSTPFLGNRSANVINFVKDRSWTRHHRDGSDHNYGDVMEYYDETDAAVTTEMIWNVTKYFTVNPDCWFSNVSFEAFDSPHDGDTLDDSIRARFMIHSVLPQDLNRVQLDIGYEYNGIGSIITDADQVDFIVTSDGVDCSYVFTIPDDTTVMNYSLCFKLYNSTGRINNIIDLNGGMGSFYNDTSGSSPGFTLYHPLGYVNGGSFGKTVLNNISGSVFTANEDGRADNITAYINLNFMSPDPYKCMLYRASDGQLIGTTTEDWISLPQEEPISSAWWAVFNFTETKPLIEKGEQYIITCWGGDTYSRVYYDDSDSPDTGAYKYYTYGNPPGMALFSDEPRYYSIYCSYTADVTAPVISNISCIPISGGLGENITITAVVTDDLSGVDEVKIRLGQVGGRLGNFTMTPVSNDTYQYVFTDSWQVGHYTYSIWAQDVSTNSNVSEWYFFNISANATISIATLQESFGSGEYINITDPPSIPDGYHLTGRGQTYNTYYNTRTGCDVLEVYAGPVNYQNNDGVWVPIDPTLETISTDHAAYTQGYRVGNEKGLYTVFFKPNSGDDWPVAFESKNDGGLGSSLIRMKLLGMGYLDPTQDWNYEVVRSVQSQQAYLDGSSVVYEDIFTGADVQYSYGAAGLKEDIILNTELHDFLIYHQPSEYDLSEDESYLVFVTQLDYSDLVMYDAADGSIIYDNTTITGGGIDFFDTSGVFQCSIPLGYVYEQDNPSENNPLMYRLILRDGNTYLLTGVKITDLISMTYPVVVDPTLSLYSSSSDGYLQANGNVYSSVRSQSTGTVYDGSSWITIGQKYNPIGISRYSMYRGAVFFDTSVIPANTVLMDATLGLYKYTDYSSTDFYLRVQNGQPVYPHDPLVSGDYDMSFYSGNGGQLYTSGFTSGYNTITLTNLSWINTSGITKLVLRSSRDIAGNTPTGNEYVSVYSSEQGSGYQPRLVVEFLNQSKIRNTGETNISGYLLIQVQYNNSGTWVVDNDTVNETLPRTINVGQQLALDLIFNGLVQTDDLSNGNGTYRVYAAFRDPDGNILITDDDRELAAWYEFEVT